MALTMTPDRTPQGWGTVADAYDTHIRPFTARFAMDALERTGLRRGEHVLDVAAGTGALSLQAARLGARVVATDFSPQMIELLKAHAARDGLEVDARVMDGQSLELPDASFDAAYSVFGLMFFPDPDKGLAEMRRVLRDDARAGIVVWNVAERSETFGEFMAAMKEAIPDLPPPAQPPAVFSLADADDLMARVKVAGFSDVQLRQAVHPLAAPTPDALWEALTRSNPVMPGILGNVGSENAERVKQAFMRRVADRVTDGQVALNGEAHVAILRA